MGISKYPVRATQPYTISVPTIITGVNDANPTNTLCLGVTVTRTGEGVYRYTFAEDLGTFLGMTDPHIGATTSADVKGYTAHRGAYDATNRRVDVSVFGATQAAADIVAAQTMDIVFFFRQTGVSG